MINGICYKWYDCDKWYVLQKVIFVMISGMCYDKWYVF